MFGSFTSGVFAPLGVSSRKVASHTYVYTCVIHCIDFISTTVCMRMENYAGLNSLTQRHRPSQRLHSIKEKTQSPIKFSKVTI